jgi:serine protease AprX
MPWGGSVLPPDSVPPAELGHFVPSAPGTDNVSHPSPAFRPRASIWGIPQRKNIGLTYISLDRQVSMSLDYLTKAVNADIAWSYGYDGSNVGIAVIDSGIYSHPDLNQEGSTQSRVVYSESFVVNDPSVSDAYGHGTHVAGIAAGNVQNAAGYKGEYRGIAPNANIINLRVLDANGRGNDSAVVAAIQRAIELKGQYNIRVLNLSLGRKVFESYTLDPLAQAVEQAWKAGIVVVVAAGNYGRDYSGGKTRIRYHRSAGQ